MQQQNASLFVQLELTETKKVLKMCKRTRNEILLLIKYNNIGIQDNIKRAGQLMLSKQNYIISLILIHFCSLGIKNTPYHIYLLFKLAKDEG